jgi:hypothetical protein
VIVADDESFILVRVTVEAANPLVSPLGAALKFAVPITVELLALPPLQPRAITRAPVIARPNHTTPLRFFAALINMSKPASARNISAAMDCVELGQ